MTGKVLNLNCIYNWNEHSNSTTFNAPVLSHISTRCKRVNKGDTRGCRTQACHRRLSLSQQANYCESAALQLLDKGNSVVLHFNLVMTKNNMKKTMKI